MRKFTKSFIFCAAALCANTAVAEPLPSHIVPNQYVVDFEDDQDSDEIKGVLGASGINHRKGPNWKDMKMEIVTATKAKIKSIWGHEDIEGIEPLTIYKASSLVGLSPNDPLYEQQWHMKRVGAEAAWGFSVGRGVTVAVVDTGVACDNHGSFHKISDLEQTECVAGFNFIDNTVHANDDQGHGSHVAGTIAQSTNNGIGGVGLAFGVKIMPVKVLSGSGSGTNAGVAAGIHWAADNGADVINLSLGGPADSGVIRRAIKFARDNNVVVVAAAGNSGGSVGYPAANDGVIAVSATDQGDKLAEFSSRGPEVDIAAPGVAVVQNTICDGGLNKCEDFPAYNGTSMATPHVAAAAALLVSQGITDPDEVERILSESAKPLGAKEHFGAGLLQADAALQNVHWKQTGVRGLMLFLLSFLMLKVASTKERLYSIKSPSFLAAGALTSMGAFFLPLVISRHALWADVLSQPLGDMSLLIDAGIHSYLPFANVFVPIAITALCLKLHDGAGKWLAGTFAGTAAYLGSVVVLGQVGFGALGVAWCVANIAACIYIGSLLLQRPQQECIVDVEG
jgi:serine protease